MSSTPSADAFSRLRFPPASGAIVGRRDEQQDEARIEMFDAEAGRPGLLLLVADGMGGHAGGREASRVAVEAFARAFQAGSSAQYRGRLREALDAANKAVGERASALRELRGMGCTIVAAVLIGNYLRWISIGDSLLLAIKDRQVVRLNADHSLAPELDRAVREGRMTQEEADNDPDRHVLRSAVTGDRMNLIDEGARRLGEGALILLATDGILTLPDARLGQFVVAGKTAERTVEEILSAIEAGMPPDQDNATLVAAYCEGAEGVVGRKRRLRRRALGLFALLIAVIAAALAAYLLIDAAGEDRDKAPPRPAAVPPRQVPPPPPRTSGGIDGSIFKVRTRDAPPRQPGRAAPAPARTPSASTGLGSTAKETRPQTPTPGPAALPERPPDDGRRLGDGHEPDEGGAADPPPRP